MTLDLAGATEMSARQRKEQIRIALIAGLEANGIPEGMELRPHDSIGTVSSHLLFFEKRNGAPSRYYTVTVKEIR